MPPPSHRPTFYKVIADGSPSTGFSYHVVTASGERVVENFANKIDAQEVADALDQAIIDGMTVALCAHPDELEALGVDIESSWDYASTYINDILEPGFAQRHSLEEGD